MQPRERGVPTVRHLFERGDHFQSVHVLQNCSLLTIFVPWLPSTISVTSLGGSNGKPADLIQRLLEIQSGGQQRSPELIAEDERLIERLRSQVGRSTQTVKLSPDNLS
jgi:hypothetical protein